jgi:hypothetical protein
LLKAIAKKENAFKPQAKIFLSKLQLDTPTLVNRGNDAQLKIELIFYSTSVHKPLPYGV